MRIDIYGLFVVSVIVPRGGWSKGRPICDLLIPNGLSSSELECYVVQRYAAFARPGREVRRRDAERLCA